MEAKLVDPAEIRELLEILSASGWDHASIVTDKFTLTLGTPMTAVGPASAPWAAPVAPVPSASPATAAVRPATTAEPHAPAGPATAPGSAPDSPAEGTTVVSAPSIGVVWRAPKPGADPFVEVGQHVEPDDVVFLIEVMKLFTPVHAKVSGVVTGFHCENGAMVEFGTPVLSIATQ